MVKEIPLTQGKVALVDDEDYDMLMQYKWLAAHCENRWVAALSPSYGPHVRIAQMLLTAQPPLVISYRDGNPLNNCRANIVLVPMSHARASGRTVHSNTGIRCVSRIERTGRYQAYGKRDGKTVHLGTFDTLEEARDARLKWAIDTYGDFAGDA